MGNKCLFHAWNEHTSTRAPHAGTPALLCSLEMGSDPTVPSQVSANFPRMQTQL